MSRYNTTTAAPRGRSPVISEETPSGFTYEGAPGFARTAKSELFLLAVAHMGSGSFYESAPERDNRLRDLVAKVAVEDPRWFEGFTPWLRGEANMRTASVVVAAEAARALLALGRPGGRRLIADALQRADEPGELIAYWRSRYGRAIPKPVKRGIADAVLHLYSEYSLLKYDTGSHGYRFGDVIELTHPGASFAKSDLFKFAIDRRHNRDDEVPHTLRMIRANAELRKAAAEDASLLLNPAALKMAGMTWEDALSLAGNKVDKRELWEALIPTMPIFALVRNLRNFDQAGVSDEAAQRVISKLTDPDVIAKSRMFPFRFLAAYRAAPSLRWSYPLEQALWLSLANVPALPGDSLILVDRSASMFDTVSAKTGLNRADTAALFGTALAARATRADLIQFGTDSGPVSLSAGESVLKALGKFGILGGTNTAGAVRKYFQPGRHNRVIILTDEQAGGGYYSEEPARYVPGDVPLYTWNLAGYKYGHGPSGSVNRHTFGGLSDDSFRMIPALEAGRDARWPWQK